MSDHLDPDNVVSCILNTFDALPQKFKPRQMDDERREWVPLAGIVLSKGHEASSFACAALATGMKCLPQDKIPSARGNVLHDWHAEILAIRGFNRWLVDECADLATKGPNGENHWLRWTDISKHGRQTDCIEPAQEPVQPFALQNDVRIHMYCSEAPCGDASMELTMADQDDPSPWESKFLTAADGTNIGMLGRGHFDRLGIVRRKPSRPDAPATLSKSCSDKLALNQITSLLSGPTSLLVHPGNAYLATLILPESQCIAKAIERSFGTSGRLAPLAQKRWEGSGYAFKPFTVMTTSEEFAFSRRTPGNPSRPAVSSNLSALYTPRRQEVLINGVLQGRKQLDPRGASCVSRRLMWRAILDIALLVGLPALSNVLKMNTYMELKDTAALSTRARVKHEARELALRGWKRNVGDAGWSLEDQ